MTTLLQCAALVVAFLLLGLAPRPAVAGMKAGTNLSSVSYFSTEWAFADAVKMSKPWMTRTVGGSEWDSGKGDSGSNKIPKDSNGWPLYAPFTVDGTKHYPHTQFPCFQNGAWTLKIDGKGKVRVTGPGFKATTYSLTTSGTKTFTLNFSGVTYNANPLTTDSYPSIRIDVLESTSGDAIRNVRMLMPGQATATSAFHQKFKASLAPYSAIRFMDWGRTNNNGITSWSSRTVKGHYTQGKNTGVAYEWMAELCNELDKDLWVCVPHAASDDYVRNMARLLRDNVESGRKIYLEYSNEVWNYEFKQWGWVNSNISGDNQAKKYGLRSKQVFDLFTSEFSANTSRGTASQRLVRVLAGQAANKAILKDALSVAGSSTDAIAIAPYFGRGIKPTDISSGIPSVDTLLKVDYWNKLAEARLRTSEHQTLAQSMGKKLLCYEGGQHYLGRDGAGDNSALTQRLVEANRSAQMRNVYRFTYLPDLASRGVSLFMQYSNCTKPSKYGSWGALEYTDQTVGTNTGTVTTPGNAVKWWALKDYVANNP